MDERTAHYYSLFAARIAERYDSVESPMAKHTGCAFETGTRILDVGAGSGRDVALLRRMGYDAYGVEPSEALRHAASTRHPELAERLTRMVRFPASAGLLAASSTVWCARLF